MSKKITLAISLLLISGSYSKSYAEATDAKSVGMGGTTLGSSNGAFTPLRNPALITDVNAAFLLPLSPTINFGGNVNSFGAFIPTGDIKNTSVLSGYLNNISKNLIGDTLKFEVSPDLPIIGFTGTPIKLADRNIGLGLNLFMKGNASFQLSGFNSLFITGVNTFTSSQGVSNDIQTLSSGFTKTFSNLQLPTSSALSSPESILSTAEEFRSSTLQPVIKAGNDSMKIADGILQTTDTIITGLEKLQNQGLGGALYADGHGVVSFSVATQVFQNKDLSLSLGTNIKGFFIPYNPTGNPISSVLGGDAQKDKLLPFNVNTKLTLGSLKSLTEVKSIFEEQIKPLVTDAKDILKLASNLDKELEEIIPLAKENIENVAMRLPELQNIASELQNKYASVNDRLGNNGSGLTSLGNNIKNQFIEDLKNLKISGEQFYDIAPFGVGADIGAQLKVGKNANIGLMLENPIVIWPSKSRKLTAALNTDMLLAGKADLNSILNSATKTENGNGNYNLTEPFAIKLGGGYKLDDVAPILTNSIVMADVEQVFNGTPFALHLGFEKAWLLGPAGLYTRVGGQYGGLGSFFSLGLGAKLGALQIDAGYGANNINPILSSNVVASLSTSLNF